VRFHSGLWLDPQQNYSTVKKKILAIVLCVSKFQDDLFSKRFLLRIDCKSAKEILQKDVKNLFLNKSLPAGKLFYWLLILTLNLSKEKAIPFMISLPQNSCKERVTKFYRCRYNNEFEQKGKRQRQSNLPSRRLLA